MEEVAVQPYKKGFLDVGNGHKLYYELCGNPKGKPVLYVHGGPGSGFSESSKKYFDPKIWHMIFFDQRGAGRSTPFASLEHNTTDDLVHDMNKILDHANVDKAMLFGGSWGSTLALVYAIRNPQRVTGLMLRGIFLPGKRDNEYYFGGGAGIFYPEVWDRFISQVPKDKQQSPAEYYADRMQHGTPEEKEHFAYEWGYYESALLHLRLNKTQVEKDLKEFNYQSLSPLEAHYLLKNCFLPDKYILDHAAELSHLPTYIIHGRYDMICQPINAYELHQKIKGSHLFFPVAGHSGDPAMKRKLMWAIKKIYPLI